MPEVDIQVLARPLAVDTVDAWIAAAALGGRSLFIGAVRDANLGKAVRGVEYEAFVPMAERVLDTIAREALERFDVERVCVHHRVGALAIGDLAVIVGVGAKHRGPAFDACRYVIDELKGRAPIWKKEHYGDGASWISPTP